MSKKWTIVKEKINKFWFGTKCIFCLAISGPFSLKEMEAILFFFFFLKKINVHQRIKLAKKLDYKIL